MGPTVFRMCVREVGRELGAMAAWPTWVLSDHDIERHRTRYGGSPRRANVAPVLLSTLRGTPFLFQGEELGLEDAVVVGEDRVDPGGRDGARAPVPWLTAAPHGWGRGSAVVAAPASRPEAAAHRLRIQRRTSRSFAGLLSRWGSRPFGAANTPGFAVGCAGTRR
ncbi:alpha-amylase family glycosyl hydrolase [Lentzea sp. NPDC004782]|uniref:alpha-amylase family glycosyl hydrolase n=1 Tax=Lentzea sp. NPDC004782 TaxID=3154458 RepID=UPI0033AEFB5A